MKSDRLLRVGYSYLGLLAGDFAVLILSLLNAFHISLLMRGQVKAQLLTAMGWFIPIAIVSIVGWILIGIPVGLIVSTRWILKATFWLILSVGALLGPLALLIIFLLLSLGMPSAETFTHTGFLMACASLISTVAFGVHCVLVRRFAGSGAGD